MSETPTNVTPPPDLTYGYVDGRIILAIGDRSDAGRMPDPVPADGMTVTFTPANAILKVASPTPATVIKQPIVCSVDANGYLVDGQAARGVWLVTGTYRVTYSHQRAMIPSHDIEVTTGHTEVAPLDLTTAMPPGGPVLAPSEYAELNGRLTILEAGGGGGGGGIELVSGTVDLNETGAPVREFYCTGAATIEGVGFTAGTCVVWRRTPGDVWGYITIDGWTNVGLPDPLEVTYRSTHNTGLSATGVGIGNPSPTRTVIVVAYSIAGGGLLDIPTACTIGGVAATVDYTVNAPSNGNPAFGVYRAIVPTGTTATVTLSGGNITGPRMSVWTVPSDIDLVDADVSNYGNTNTVALTTVDGGFIVAAASGDFGPDRTWTNATRRHIETYYSAADADTTGTSQSLVFNGYGSYMVAAAYGPSA